jgi:murein DD-endopeptidase MepM/ murein hydrolase activator NlpD
MRTLILTFICTAFSMATPAQDKLAALAPVDWHAQHIDSVSIARVMERENLQNPAFSLYQSWNNTYTTKYGVEIPNEYVIDLRGFHMPCESRLVTSSYGYRRSFHRNHYGTDIKVYVGDTIYAAFAGKVRIVAYEGRGYGKYVVIRHPNGLETLYGHMSKQLVSEDQVVKAGQPIGLGGNTGRSTGSHLHFETRFLGQFINPELLFDFEHQDVLGDCYIFRSRGRGQLLAKADYILGKEYSMTEEDSKLATEQAQKQAESRSFQEQRKESIRQGGIYKVRSGDTLGKIARKFGTTVAQLCRTNKISAKTPLRAGQILRY